MDFGDLHVLFNLIFNIIIVIYCFYISIINGKYKSPIILLGSGFLFLVLYRLFKYENNPDVPFMESTIRTLSFSFFMAYLIFTYRKKEVINGK